MNKRLPDAILSQLSEFIADRTALQFSPERWNDLDRRAGYAAEDFGFNDKEAFVKWLVSSSLNKDHMEILARHLTVSETYFWRESRIFDALQSEILPQLIKSRENGEKRLRIWSAGCATGEEPYSLAIAISRSIPDLKKWHVTILATDINTFALQKAPAGIYSKWSFRNAPAWLEKKYFRPLADDKFEIIPEIRKMVTFRYLNLSEDVYPSPLTNTDAMDLIFCRNVFMYFAPARAEQVRERLYRSIIDGGWLIVAAVELSRDIFRQFSAVHFPGAAVYRKLSPDSRISTEYKFEEFALSQTSTQVPLNGTPDTDPLLKCNFYIGVEENSKVRAVDAMEDIKPPTDYDLEKYKDNEVSNSDMAVSVRNLADQGRLSEALALCEKSLAADKLDTEMHFLHAIILQERNHEEDAIASLKRALYINSEFIPANFLLGNLLMRQGNTHAGKKYLQNVLTLLKSRPHDDVLPESDGLTAGRLKDIVRATMGVRIVD